MSLYLIAGATQYITALSLALVKDYCGQQSVLSSAFLSVADSEVTARSCANSRYCPLSKYSENQLDWLLMHVASVFAVSRGSYS